jgi:hypothetical protein
MPLLEDLYAKQRARQIELLPFFYSTQFLNSAAAAAATVMQSIPIQSDSHFIARYFAVTVYNSAPFSVFTGLAALTIQFFDTGSGRTLFDNPQAIQNVCGGTAGTAGNGSLPFIIPEPWLLRAGGSIQVSIGNLGILTFPRVDVSIPGFKAFKFGGGSPAEI